jgi:2-polyprenyl-3-methyl-5-hydroxy-6-metoxy-1,4-benzoquinol methylase
VTANHKLAGRKALKYALFPAVLLGLPILWVIQLLIFFPVLIITAFTRRPVAPGDGPTPAYSNYVMTSITFNRVRDISKLNGCNTRNVRYRWKNFKEAIDCLVARRGEKHDLHALDFGAGSLRDTYELARLGFQVDALDKNEKDSTEAVKCYDWGSVTAPPNISSASLLSLREQHYDLIVAFDVIEHLYDAEDTLRILQSRLKPNGIMCVTVPNGRSLLESLGRRAYERRKRSGLPLDTSGVPHVQHRTPEEWASCFQASGFEILDHDMAIGFLVNDVWHGFYAILARSVIEPVFVKIGLFCRIGYPLGSFEKLFFPAWLMQRIHQIDLRLKPYLQHRWGWNLFVLSKQPKGTATR